jgi:hypothetical protein
MIAIYGPGRREKTKRSEGEVVARRLVMVDGGRGLSSCCFRNVSLAEIMVRAQRQEIP